MKTEDVEAVADRIVESAKERQSGDIAGQIFYLTQAVCLLARITSDNAK